MIRHIEAIDGADDGKWMPRYRAVLGALPELWEEVGVRYGPLMLEPAWIFVRDGRWVATMAYIEDLENPAYRERVIRWADRALGDDPLYYQKHTP